MSEKKFENLESLVGLASTPVVNVVEKGAVRRFSEAIGEAIGVSNPAYSEGGEAAKDPVRGRLVAPPTFPRTFEYGSVGGVEAPGHGLIHGEHRIFYERPLFVGEAVVCRVEVSEYFEKESRGGLLGFLVTESFGDAPDGTRIFTMRDTLILTPPMREGA